MKILHIQVLPKLSGVQKISLEILKSLPSEYDKYILFSDSLDCGDRDECIHQFTNAGVKVLFSKNLKREINIKDFKAILEIYKLCKKERFDIVHTHSTIPGIIGRIAATLAHVPLVLHTVHGLAFHDYLKFPKWHFYWACEMFASLFCDKIILVNKYYSKYFRWCKNKVLTIYNGINFQSLPYTYPKPIKSDCKIQALYVGRLDFPKNPICLLEAASIVCKKYPDVRFILVGDGEYYKQCKAYIIDHKLNANVMLEGWQTNIAQYYYNSDIFVSTSIYEAFGLTFIEAGFYELPIVTTNVEGIPEVVENSVTGLLCNPNNATGIANNIIRLIEDPELRKRMGMAGRKRCLKLFNVENMVNQYLQLYSK